MCLALRLFIARRVSPVGKVFCAMGQVQGWKFWLVLGHACEITPVRTSQNILSKSNQLYAFRKKEVKFIVHCREVLGIILFDFFNSVVILPSRATFQIDSVCQQFLNAFM